MFNRQIEDCNKIMSDRLFNQTFTYGIRSTNKSDDKTSINKTNTDNNNSSCFSPASVANNNTPSSLTSSPLGQQSQGHHHAHAQGQQQQQPQQLSPSQNNNNNNILSAAAAIQQQASTSVVGSSVGSSSATNNNNNNNFGGIVGAGRLSRSPIRRFSGRALAAAAAAAAGGHHQFASSTAGGAADVLEGSILANSTGVRLFSRLNVNESHLKQKIQALEDTVAEYERQKFSVMGTFAEYRERVVERERKLEAEYSAKIITLSEDVLAAKRDFEDRMKQFQALQEKFEREKEQALEKLREEHQKEIQSLEGRCSEAHLLNLEQKYILEIQRLEEERKSLRIEKEKLGETFESKLRRAQTLYETELNAAKCLYRTELEAFQDHEEALKEELIGRQEEFRDRLEDLQQQFTSNKEELAKWKREVVELEDRLQQKEIEVQAISRQLREAKRETDEALERMRKAEKELHVTKQKCQEHEEQLVRKSDMLAVIEGAKSKLELVIHELQIELKSLKGKVAFLENERQNLESQSQSQAQLNDKQLQTFEKVLDNVNKQSENVKEEYEQKLENERVTFEEREYSLKQEYVKKLSELEKQHQEFQLKFDLKLNEERKKIAEEIKLLTEKEMINLKAQKDILEKELVTMKDGQLKEDTANIAEAIPHVCDFHEHHKQEVDELKIELETKLREQIEKELKHCNEDENQSFENYDETINQLKKTIQDLHSTITTLNNKIEQLEDITLEELKRKLNSTLAENEVLVTDLDSARRELNAFKRLQESKIEELSQQIENQHEKYKDSVNEQIAKEMASTSEKEVFERNVKNIQNELELKDKQMSELRQQLDLLKDELLRTSKDLMQKTNELDELKIGTEEYIQNREYKQNKKHHDEIERLRKEHESEMQKLAEAQSRHPAEKETLLNKSAGAETVVREKKAEVEKHDKELKELKERLKRKDDEIKKLQDEKHSLEHHETAHHSKIGHHETTKETHLRSVLSSPIGSMDSLKKRDSICSVGSVKEAQICRKANMAIVNKWQCLVDQMKNGSGSRRRDSRSSLPSVPAYTTSYLNKTLGNAAGTSAAAASTSASGASNGRHTYHTHAHKHLDSQDSTSTSHHHGGSSCASSKSHLDESDDRSGRSSVKSPAPSSGLKPIDSRRSSAKSPSRSPVPTPKFANASKKPAWRL